MKNLIFLSFSLATLTGYSQSQYGFPFYTTQPVMIGNTIMGSHKWDQIQGRPIYPQAAYQLNATRTRDIIVTENTSIGTISYEVPIGFIARVEEVKITADRPVNFDGWIDQGNFSAAHYAGSSAPLLGTLGKLTQEYTFKVPYDIQERGRISLTFYTYEANQERPVVKVLINGLEIPRDQFPGAKSIILTAGASRTHMAIKYSFGGTTTGDNFFHNVIAQSARDDGKSCLSLPKGFGGSNSGDMALAFTTGFYDRIPYDALIIQMGINDAGATSVTSSWITNNLREAIRHRNRFRPNAPIFFLSTGISDMPTLIPNIPTVNQGIKDLVNIPVTSGPYKNDNCYYVDVQNVLTLSTTANNPLSDFSEGTLGSQLHWSAQGQVKVGNYVYSQIKNILLPALKDK